MSAVGQRKPISAVLLSFLCTILSTCFLTTSNASDDYSPWPMAGGNRFHTRSTSVIGPSIPALRWRIDLKYYPVGEPTIGVDGNIYIMPGKLIALSPNGKIVWEKPGISVTPAVASNGNLYTYIGAKPSCLSYSNGALIWDKENKYAVGALTIGYDSVYFSSGKYTLDGDRIGPEFPFEWYFCTVVGCWTLTSVSEPRDNVSYFYGVYGQPCGTGGVWSCATLASIYLYCDIYGNCEWKTHWTDDSWSYYWCSAPAVHPNGNVIVCGGTPTGKIIRAYAPEGNVLWTYPLPGASDIAIAHNETIHTSVYTGNAYAINPDGSTRWIRDIGYGVVSLPVVDGSNTVYYRTPDRLVAVRDDGSIKWKLEIESGGGSNPPVAAVFGKDGTMYLDSPDGYFNAYGDADLNDSGRVDFFDLDVFFSHWLDDDCSYPNWCDGTDLDCSGRVDFNDYTIFAQHWLESVLN